MVAEYLCDMNNPLVSILSPCYNVVQFLPKYFDSVLGQTYRNLQVVLIEDGSKDNTWAVMQEYATKDSRVEVYHQENQGVAATRNNLLDKVKGDYVLFVDSDDWIELDMVEYLVGLAQKYNSKFVMCDRVINDAKPKDSEPIIKILTQEQAVCDFLHHDYFVGSLWNKLLSSSLLHNGRFHCGISYGEDALFCWGVLQKVDNVVVTDRQLYHYYMNEESISHQSFGEKKLTGRETWRILTDEVAAQWPQYIDIVTVKSAMNDMTLLQAAVQSGYPRNEHVRSMQLHLRDKYKLVCKSGLKGKRRFYYVMIMWWYGFGKVYYMLNRIKERVFC